MSEPKPGEDEALRIAREWLMILGAKGDHWAIELAGEIREYGERAGAHAIEEHEAAICPEDFGCAEVVAALQEKLAHAEASGHPVTLKRAIDRSREAEEKLRQAEADAELQAARVHRLLNEADARQAALEAEREKVQQAREATAAEWLPRVDAERAERLAWQERAIKAETALAAEREAHERKSEFLRRFIGWDHLPYVGDGPGWKAEAESLLSKAGRSE